MIHTVYTVGMGIDRGYRRTKAQEWREEIPPEDTAPLESATRLDPAEWGMTAEQAREMLSRQMCPACGEGPWKSPLNHASRKHGFDRFAMRDACGLTTTESVADPELSARFTERGRALNMTTVTAASRDRKKQRWTRAGRQKNAAILTNWEAEHPLEAKSARAAAGRAGAATRWGE